MTPDTGETVLRALFALVAVLGLLGLFAYALRRFGPRFGLMPTLPEGLGKKRLTLVESTMLDVRHRAAILRCDDDEYLVILGGAQPVLTQLSHHDKANQK